MKGCYIIRVMPACKFSTNCLAFKYLREKKPTHIQRGSVYNRYGAIKNQGMSLQVVLSMLWLVLNSTTLQAEVLLILPVGAF